MIRTCRREPLSVFEEVQLRTEKEKAITYVSDESTPREAFLEVVGHDVRDLFVHRQSTECGAV